MTRKLIADIIAKYKQIQRIKNRTQIAKKQKSLILSITILKRIINVTQIDKINNKE